MICLSWSSRVLRYFFLLKWWLFDIDFYSLQTSEDHKILESSRLEGVSGGLQCNCLLRAGLALISDQVSQSCVQLGLENLQGWHLHSFSDWPVLLPGCLYEEKVSLQILLPAKFDWMTFSVFNCKKAATEEIRENTGFCRHQLANGPAEHARGRIRRHHQTWLRHCLGLRNIWQEVTITPRSVPSSALPLCMLSVW